ncbi:MAG TPA: PilZ domain-containing protein [Blastocatellia bacterium]|nr:PilZ domain-containing protein [Blastocatellia bacterium]
MTRPTLSYRMLGLVRNLIHNRRAARRISSALPVRFSIVRLLSAAQSRRSRSISAITTDLSLSGLALETSVIQVDNFHVSLSSDMTSKQFLEIELDLPDRRIRIEGQPLRYERRNSGTGNYVVGVKIISMSPEDWQTYEEYLKEAGR